MGREGMGLSAQDGVGGARGAGRLRFRFQLVLHGLRIQRAAQRASAACAGAGAGSGAAGHRPLPPAVRPSNPLGEPTPKNGRVGALLLPAVRTDRLLPAGARGKLAAGRHGVPVALATRAHFPASLPPIPWPPCWTVPRRAARLCEPTRGLGSRRSLPPQRCRRRRSEGAKPLPRRSNGTGRPHRLSGAAGRSPTGVDRRGENRTAHGRGCSSSGVAHRDIIKWRFSPGGGYSFAQLTLRAVPCAADGGEGGIGRASLAVSVGR